jgi:hypothetical protein
MAPPPLAPEVVDAPLPLDDLDNNAQDSSVTMLETAGDAEGEADGDKVEMLQYDLEDVVHLIKTVNTLLEAHKATTQETVTPGAPGGADKTRYTTVLAQKLAQHKVDLQHGLRERLQQRSLARPEFAYAALQSLLALSPYAHGFMARACGYPLSPFVLRQAASCLTFPSLPSPLILHSCLRRALMGASHERQRLGRCSCNPCADVRARCCSCPLLLPALLLALLPPVLSSLLNLMAW